MATVKKEKKAEQGWQGRENLNPGALLVRIQMVRLLRKTVWQFLKK